MKSPYPTIYARIVEYAAEMLIEHPRWDVDKALMKASEQSRLFHAYLLTFKKQDREELARDVKIQRDNARREWELRR